MLFAVKNSVRIFLFALGIFGLPPLLLSLRTPGQSTTPQEAPAPPAPTPPQTATPAPQAPLPPASPSGPVIVLDPAHGGTDSGARGPNAVEKDIVLQIARTTRSELEREGFHVVLTRNDDSNPSYDDRAATANALREAIFISLHVSSTGPPGSVRAYYDEFSTPVPIAMAAPTPSLGANLTGLTPWNEAQRSYVIASRRLADLVQIEIAQHFPASPDTSTGVAVRGLRSVASPAVAIELSSISAPDLNSLTGSAAPLAAAIGTAIQAFRAQGQVGVR
jgi:N-acetylmuramoyl-L-alanine amidase